MSYNEEENNIRKLRDTSAHWVKGAGPFDHIIVSSRIRLARNIADMPFPYKATDRQLKKIIDLSEKIFCKNEIFDKFNLIKLNNLTDLDIQFLVEKRLISISQAQFNRPFRAFAYNFEEVTSIMINEEDHFRIQCMAPGLQLKKIWKMIDWYDNQIGEEVKYAFNENEGFLTCCPTNVGTGLRVSLMMHLPALMIINQLDNLMTSVSKRGYAVRGFYGEGTDFQGNFFQLSNQSTLGLPEKEIIKNLELVSNKLIEKEQQARDELMLRSKKKIEDQVLRAYGILTNAKIISTVEAIDLLSKLRFGIELGILAEIGYDTINHLMLIVQPSYLQLLKGQKINQEQLDSARAVIIKEVLN